MTTPLIDLSVLQGVPPAAQALLYPMLALVGWTMTVLLLIPFRRIQAARAGHVVADDFKLGESQRVPAHVSLPNRNYMNLLELPVLFYVVCFIYYLTRTATDAVVVLAWAYVALRVVHSLVHLTYNHVIHRLMAFATSNVVLSVMWWLLLWRLLTRD